MAQWIAINQVGPEGLRSLIRTFQEVFPHTSLWLNGGYLLLLGRTEPLRIPLPDFLGRYRMTDPLGGVAKVAPDPFDLLGRFVSSGPALRAWAATGRLNTEETSFIEYDTPKQFATLNTVALAIRNLRPLIDLHRPLADVFVASRAEDVEKLERISRASRLLLEGIVARGEGRLEQARQRYELSYRLNPSNYQARGFLTQDLAARGREALLREDLVTAEQLLRRAMTLHDGNPDARFDLALVAAKRGDDVAAVAHLLQLLLEHP
jgi:spermidine synthase